MLLDAARNAYRARLEGIRKMVADRFHELFGHRPGGVSSDGSWVSADGLLFRYEGGKFFVLVRCGSCQELALQPVESLEELGMAVAGDFHPDHRCWRPLSIPPEIEHLISSAVIPVGRKRRSIWEDDENDSGVEEQDSSRRTRRAGRVKG